MILISKDSEAIDVVKDQPGSPTYARYLESSIMQIITTDKFIPGIYHYTNEGVTTWCGFAKEIAGLIHTNCIVNPISTAQFPTPAARPAYSVLDTEKLSSVYGLAIPAWQHSLKKCIALLQNQ